MNKTETNSIEKILEMGKKQNNIPIAEKLAIIPVKEFRKTNCKNCKNWFLHKCQLESREDGCAEYLKRVKGKELLPPNYGSSVIPAKTPKLDITLLTDQTVDKIKTSLKSRVETITTLNDFKNFLVYIASEFVLTDPAILKEIIPELAKVEPIKEVVKDITWSNLGPNKNKK